MELFIFKNIYKREILESVTKAFAKKDFYVDAISNLVNFAMENGYKNNIWYAYLAHVLAYNENPFSIACENNGKVFGSTSIIMHDIEVFMDLFALDIKKISMGYENELTDFQMEREGFINYDIHAVNIISTLADDLSKCKIPAQFYNTLISFYQKYGVGDYGFSKAFRLTDDKKIVPIKDVLNISFDDLVGYDWQKKRLRENTLAFVSGKKANNVLLYGDSGTGKSSSIKAVLNEFAPYGLRMIEVYKHQLSDVIDLIAALKNRHYYFVIYMDDLSFEEEEASYKYLKSIIEGGLEATPSNVLIYATSNRRHLVKETFKDNGEIGDDLHRNETKAEKLSLAARFGLSILYMSPNSFEYKQIVKKLAMKYNIEISEDELLSKATQWELKYGSLSGRTATQFINYITSNNDNI